MFRLLEAAGDSLGLDGENSLDCGVVPSIDTTHAQMDTGGFNLLQVSIIMVILSWSQYYDHIIMVTWL